MTALKPIEARNVRGVSTTKYKVNDICSHPNCQEPRGDRGHHIFPRSQIGNSSYFVCIEGENQITIPHVTGLCSAHHLDVEAHRAWIKLENDQFVWYNRESHYPPPTDEYSHPKEWQQLGPLNPQP